MRSVVSVDGSLFQKRAAVRFDSRLVGNAREVSEGRMRVTIVSLEVRERMHVIVLTIPGTQPHPSADFPRRELLQVV